MAIGHHVSMDRVPFQRPQLPSAEHIERYFSLARAAHWFSNEGPCACMLRDRLVEYVSDSLRCVLVSSGTLGLVVALRATASRHPARREVVVPSYTYVASISAILWAGFVPVFVDVAPGHWHLDPDALASALSEHQDCIAAVMACSTFGCAPPLSVRSSWEASCDSAGVPLIVDSAAGFGSRDEQKQRLGGQGVAEVFSFHATKPFAIGEGGAVFSADEELANELIRQTRFGFDDDRALVGEPGLNAKMSEIHAATALACLDGFEAVLQARAQRAMAMRTGLIEHGFAFQDGCAASASQFVPALAPNGTVRDDILRAAGPAGVQLRTYYQPLHLEPALMHFRTAGDLSVTNDLAARALSLPLANDLTDEEIARVRALLIKPISRRAGVRMSD